MSDPDASPPGDNEQQPETPSEQPGAPNLVPGDGPSPAGPTVSWPPATSEPEEEQAVVAVSPPPVTEAHLAPSVPVAAPTRAPAGVTALLIALFVLMLALLAAGGLAYKLWADRSSAQAALSAAVVAMSTTASPELSSAMAPRLQRIQQAIEQGRFVEAASRFQHLSKGVTPASGSDAEWASPLAAIPGGQAPTASPGSEPAPVAPRGSAVAPGAAAASAGQLQAPPGSDLPPGVMEFFERNPKLGQAFARANVAGRELRDSGGDVARLREIRALIIEAARLNDAQRVVQLLKKFKQEFEVQARKLEERRARRARSSRLQVARPKAPPRQMATLASRINKALERARLQGRDLRKVFPLLRQADRAAAAGDFHRALELSQAALAAIESAPPLPQTPGLFRNPLVDMFLALLHREDQQLGTIFRSLQQASRKAPDSTLEQLTAAVRNAVDGLSTLGAQRRAFGRRLQEIRVGRAQPLSPEQADALLRERAQRARDQIGALLARAREMSPEEFAANRSRMVDELLAAVFGRPVQQRLPAAAARPRGEGAPAQTQAASGGPAPTAEQRVREKLLAATGPFLQLKADPSQAELVGHLQKLFEQARSLLAAGDAVAAEKLVDEGLQLLERGVPASASGPGDSLPPPT